MKILGIAGSLREGSYSEALLKLALKSVEAQGHQGVSLDLGKMDLPFCDGSSLYPKHPDVRRLKQAVLESDGLILVTPEYHGSMSGVLKNCLDLLTYDEMERKTLALMSVLGGVHSNNALNALRLVGRTLHAFVIPQQLSVAAAHHAFEEDGALSDPQTKERLDVLVTSLLDYTERMSS